VRVSPMALPSFFPQIGPATFYSLFEGFGPPLPPPSETAWAAEAETIVRHHLSAFALQASNAGAGLPSRISARFRERSFAEAGETTRVLLQSASAIESVLAQEIPLVILKGPGIARFQGGEVMRPYNDIDLLVPPRFFRRTMRLLQAQGYREDPRSIPTRAILDSVGREAVNLRSASGGSIDLHHHVAPWLWGDGLRFERIHRASESRPVAGVTLPMASAEHNLLIAALHVVSDRGRPGRTLRAWRDVVVLAHASAMETVAREASDTDLAGWLLWILWNLPEAVRPGELYDVLLQVGGLIPNARRLQRLLPPHAASRHLMGQLLRLPLPNALAFAASTALPSRSFLAAKYPGVPPSYVTWWKESVRGLQDVRLEENGEVPARSKA
jgi:hypothetical protein